MLQLVRTLIFARFTVVEYVRSGRILAELLALVPMLIFLTPQGTTGISATQFFTITSFFVLVQAAYTTFRIMGLGRRAEGFLIMVRPIGRNGYVLGLYLASLTITLMVFVFLTLITIALGMINQQVPGMTLTEWVQSLVPLMLDAAIVGALLTLLAPLVSTAWPRLIVLGLIGVALSKDAFALMKLDFGEALLTLQTVLSVPLVPLLGGLSLAIQSNLNEIAVEVMLSQVILMLVLLVISLVFFSRRDLILNS